ncbi:MAG TPA: hypothetical protein VNE21_02805 [Mycobacteriales bacterium]|nr:hypothetical protein [Mycobacteriales bacterium]
MSGANRRVESTLPVLGLAEIALSALPCSPAGEASVPVVTTFAEIIAPSPPTACPVAET